MSYNFKDFDAQFPDDAACLDHIFMNETLWYVEVRPVNPGTLHLVDGAYRELYSYATEAEAREVCLENMRRMGVDPASEVIIRPATKVEAERCEKRSVWRTCTPWTWTLRAG